MALEIKTGKQIATKVMAEKHAAYSEYLEHGKNWVSAKSLKPHLVRIQKISHFSQTTWGLIGRKELAETSRKLLELLEK